MRCINKSHPGFKQLAKAYGEQTAELAIRLYTKRMSTKDEEFLYPPLTEMYSFFKRNKQAQINLLKQSLYLDPNLNRDQIFNILQGIITKANKNYPDRIVKGGIYEEGMLELNKKLYDDLVKEFPYNFLYTNTNRVNQGIEIRGGDSTQNNTFLIKNLLNYDNSISELVDFLKEDIPNNIEKQILLEIVLNKLQDKFNIKWQFDRTSYKKGYIRGGIVYINPDLATADTPIHEFFHPVLEAMKQRHPDMYKVLSAQSKRITNLQTNQLVYNEVKSLYPEYSEEELIDETIVTGLGLAGINKLQEDAPAAQFLKTILEFLTRIFKAFELKGIPNINTPLISFAQGALEPTFHSNLRPNAKNADQRASLDEIVKNLKTLNSNIPSQTIPGESEDEDVKKIYKDLISGLIIPSVHEKIIDPFYKKKFPKPYEDTPRSIFLRDSGTFFHYFIEDLFTVKVPVLGTTQSILNENGSLNKVFLKNPNHFYNALMDYVDSITSQILNVPGEERVNLTNDATQMLFEGAYKMFEDVIETYLKKYGPDVRFLVEQRGVNKDKSLAGTADLVILNDKQFSVLDWKTVDASRFNIYSGQVVEKEQLPVFKKLAYKLQLREYTKMFSTLTGLQLDEAKAIPIGLKLTNKMDPVSGMYVKDLYNISEVKFQKLEDKELLETSEGEEARYLLPVVIKSQDKDLQELINKLEYFQQEYYTKSKKGNLETKQEIGELKFREITKIIQDLSILNHYKSLLERINTLLELSEKELSKEESDINLDHISDIMKELEIYKNVAKYFDTEDKDISSQFAIAERNVHVILKLLYDKRDNILAEEAKGFGIENLTSNEKAYSTLQKWFRETSAIKDIKTLNFFWALKNKLSNEANYEKKKILKDLQSFLDIPQKDLDLFFSTEKGKKRPWLISQYNISSIIDENRYDLFDFNQEAYDKAKANYSNWLDKNLSLDYVNEEDSENILYIAKLQKSRERKEKLLEEWESKHLGSPFLFNTSGKTTINNRFYKLNESRAIAYETPEYKKLKQNPKSVELFKFIQQINKEAYETGLVSNYRNFYPSVQASRSEKLLIDKDVKSIFNNPFDGKYFDAEENEETASKIEIDPFTGEQRYVIPKLYQRSLVKKTESGENDYSDYSFNLIKNYGKFYVHLQDFKVKQELEEKIQYIAAIEKNKVNLVVKPNSKIQTTENDLGELVPELKPGINENYEILKKQADFYIYGKTEFSEYSANKLPGTQINAVRALRKTMAWRSVTTLGLNVLSASSALFGGFSNILLESNRNGIFNKSDVNKALSSIGKLIFKDKVALDVFNQLREIDPLIDNLDIERINKLSTSKIDRELTQEKLYVLMRSADKFIQYTVGHAVLNNYFINENNELVNITDFVKSKLDYETQFNKFIVSKEYSKIKELDKLVDKQVLELKSQSLLNKPVSLSEDNKSKLRTLIRKLSTKVIGNASQEDISNAKTSVLGSIAMQFKSWIPRLATERFGNAEIDPVTNKLNWGKYLTTASLLSKDLLSLTTSAFGQLNEASVEKMTKKYNELLNEYVLNGGTEESFITFSEFQRQYLANIRSTLKEIILIISLMSLIASLHLAWDDDDESLTGYQRLTLNMLSKFENELTFFWNPSSASDLLNKPFPVIQTLTDVQKFASHISKELFNQSQEIITGDEEDDLRRAKPMKYFFKLFPVTKEMLNWAAIADEDFRKNWDIKLNYNK